MRTCARPDATTTRPFWTTSRFDVSTLAEASWSIKQEFGEFGAVARGRAGNAQHGGGGGHGGRRRKGRGGQSASGGGVRCATRKPRRRPGGASRRCRHRPTGWWWRWGWRRRGEGGGGEGVVVVVVANHAASPRTRQRRRWGREDGKRWRPGPSPRCAPSLHPTGQRRATLSVGADAGEEGDEEGEEGEEGEEASGAAHPRPAGGVVQERGGVRPRGQPTRPQAEFDNRREELARRHDEAKQWEEVVRGLQGGRSACCFPSTSTA